MDYLAANQRVGNRYFPADLHPPAPASEPFFAERPKHSLRVFVLGESAAAGFPFVANGSFADYAREALQDALPGDTVEVINLGIAATNSYTIADFADEVIAQNPDAVLIYAGHNEYYGALGVGSNERLGAEPSLVRLYLKLQRLKTVLLLRNMIARVASTISPSNTGGDSAVTRMETVVRDQQIRYGGTTYERGKVQFESNLRTALKKFRKANVRVIIGSVVSNTRDLAPFAVLSGAEKVGAEASAYTAGRAALARGDLAAADSLFTVARDMDFVRFRAPTAFNAIIERVAREEGAHFVPVESRVRAASQYRIPGADLFYEHVHMNRTGYSLLGQVYVDGLRAAGAFRDSVMPSAHWARYDSSVALTSLDERIAEHLVRTVTTRWPFVPVSARQDYRATYRPADLVDSLAFGVSRGALRWDRAKFLLGQHYESVNKPELALAEYRGLMRHETLNELGFESAGRVMMTLGKSDSARALLQRAYALRPSAVTAYALGTLALKAHDITRAISMLEESVRLDPANPAALYQLSFAYAMARDITRARATAMRIAQIKPDYPGLRGWLKVLGLTP